jgi:hypothetical protein
MRITVTGILLIASLLPGLLFAASEGQIKEYLDFCRELINKTPEQFASMAQDELLRHLLASLVCSEPEISSKLEEHERNRIHDLTKKYREVKENLPKDKRKGVEKWEEYFKVKYEEEMGKARIYKGEELRSLDAHLKAIWKEMLDALRRKDVDRAVTYFSRDKREVYRSAFLAIKDKLPEVARDLEDIQLIEMRTSRDVEYDIQSSKNGQRYSHPLIFKKEIDGEWRIQHF